MVKIHPVPQRGNGKPKPIGPCPSGYGKSIDDDEFSHLRVIFEVRDKPPSTSSVLPVIFISSKSLAATRVLQFLRLDETMYRNRVYMYF